jgi:hypothetical protein
MAAGTRPSHLGDAGIAQRRADEQPTARGDLSGQGSRQFAADRLLDHSAKRQCQQR